MEDFFDDMIDIIEGNKGLPTWVYVTGSILILGGLLIWLL